jgi:hypothetical protein
LPSRAAYGGQVGYATKRLMPRTSIQRPSGCACLTAPDGTLAAHRAEHGTIRGVHQCFDLIGSAAFEDVESK